MCLCFKSYILPVCNIIVVPFQVPCEGLKVADIWDTTAGLLHSINRRPVKLPRLLQPKLVLEHLQSFRSGDNCLHPALLLDIYVTITLQVCLEPNTKYITECSLYRIIQFNLCILFYSTVNSIASKYSHHRNYNDRLKMNILTSNKTWSTYICQLCICHVFDHIPRERHKHRV